jgi:ankyrin repeat protein
VTQIGTGSTSLSSPWVAYFASLEHSEVVGDDYASLHSAKQNFGRGKTRSIQHVLSMIYLASNNLLDAKHTALAFEVIRGCGNHGLLKAIIASSFPSVKAIAKAFVAESVRSRDLQLVKAIFDLGISPNSFAGDSGTTPLGIAIRTRNIDMARILLSYGADANGRSYSGATMLMEAVRTRDLELVQFMLSSGADVNRVPT